MTIRGVCKHAWLIHRYAAKGKKGDVGKAATDCGQVCDWWTRTVDRAWKNPPKGYRQCAECRLRAGNG